MNLLQRKRAFVLLAEFLSAYKFESDTENNAFDNAIRQAAYNNPWFTIENIMYAIQSIAKSISAGEIENWLHHYSFEQTDKEKTKKVGIVMAGNLPLVGFHDFFYVLMSGYKVIAKLSSDDKYLLPAIATKLIEFEPLFENKISFTEELLENFDAVIATGSDNTARYFEYYFGKYPHIIRKNRNAIAILTGNESKDDILALCNDILRHYGKGCRNVSKLLLPEGYDFNLLLGTLAEFAPMLDNNKYLNNYNYYKSIYMINILPFYDNGSIILKEEKLISSPISVVYYEFYKNITEVNKFITENTDKIQCIISDSAEIENTIPFGKAQCPSLMDYADGVDVMNFLLNDIEA